MTHIFSDVTKDKEEGMPSVICRNCCTVVITFDQFKRRVEDGQKKLNLIMQRRRLREEEEQKRKLQEAGQTHQVSYCITTL